MQAHCGRASRPGPGPPAHGLHRPFGSSSPRPSSTRKWRQPRHGTGTPPGNGALPVSFHRGKQEAHSPGSLWQCRGDHGTLLSWGPQSGREETDTSLNVTLGPGGRRQTHSVSVSAPTTSQRDVGSEPVQAESRPERPGAGRRKQASHTGRPAKRQVPPCPTEVETGQGVRKQQACLDESCFWEAQVKHRWRPRAWCHRQALGTRFLYVTKTSPQQAHTLLVPNLGGGTHRSSCRARAPARDPPWRWPALARGPR